MVLQISSKRDHITDEVIHGYITFFALKLLQPVRSLIVFKRDKNVTYTLE